MSIYINRERLASTFTELCELSSPSKKEREVYNYLKRTFMELEADELIIDDSREVTGSDSPNLIVRFNPTAPEKEGVFFSCHMDTVEPGDNVQVVRVGDIFTSKADTVLGSDDKSGITAIIELIRMVKENDIPHGLIEIVLTTCEEIGLLGAKALDYKQIKAPYGYALDSSGIEQVVTAAPAANQLKIEVKGLAAHAGLHPESGVSAIHAASKAIATLSLGRLDEESTANFGLIEGGTATNIIPEKVTIQGEVRSHSLEKLEHYTNQIEAAFHKVIELWQNPFEENIVKPVVEFSSEPDYPVMRLEEDSPVLNRVRKAGEAIGQNLVFHTADGGSDANILNGYGLPTAIIATGMEKVHTTDEQLDLNDLVKLTELIYAIVVT